MIVLNASRLVDGISKEAYGPGTIVVEGDIIKQIGPTDSVDVPADAEVIHLGDVTLLPGLVDAHSHFGFGFGCPNAGGTSISNYDSLLRAVGYAEHCLYSGVTTMRTLSERDYLDISYRDAIEKDWIKGPRTLVATRGLQTPHSQTSVTDIHVSGVDEVRRAVRENINAGADVIKLFLTPPSAFPDPVLAYFTLAEIEAAVEEAHRANKKVSVHAHGGQAVDDAITAGVDTIEHGVFMTPEQFERMAQSNIWFVVTQSIRLWDDKATQSEGLLKAREATEKMIKIARQHDVRIAAGTDGGHGLMYFEMKCLVNAGFSPMESIQIGTNNGAEAIGLLNKTGTLEPGKWADVIAVAGDPTSNIDDLQNVEFVMKAGKIYKQPGASGPASS